MGVEHANTATSGWSGGVRANCATHSANWCKPSTWDASVSGRWSTSSRPGSTGTEGAALAGRTRWPTVLGTHVLGQPCSAAHG